MAGEMDHLCAVDLTTQPNTNNTMHYLLAAMFSEREASYSLMMFGLQSGLWGSSGLECCSHDWELGVVNIAIKERGKWTVAVVCIPQDVHTLVHISCTHTHTHTHTHNHASLTHSHSHTHAHTHTYPMHHSLTLTHTHTCMYHSLTHTNTCA